MDLLRHKSVPVTIVGTDADQGIIEAIVAVVGNVDSGRERIQPGFFTASLARKYPKGVWMHDWAQPVAKTLDVRELLPGDPLLPAHLATLGGYLVKGQFNLDTQRGREAFSDLKFGTVDEFSIGYLVIREQYQAKENVTDLLEGEWFEWSPVLVGMNRATALLSAKSGDPAGAGRPLVLALKCLDDADFADQWTEYEAMDLLRLLLNYVRQGRLLAQADAAALVRATTIMQDAQQTLDGLLAQACPPLRRIGPAPAP